MKPSKIVSFTFRFLLLSACLHIVISCKGEASNSNQKEDTNSVQEVVSIPDLEKVSNSTKEETSIPAKEEVSNSVQEAVISSAKGIAHFESGLKAADANNMPLAYKEFLLAAKAGHVYAQYNVGLMYEQGLGITKNVKEAVYWYNESAMQGNSAAQFNLGVCFENGIGTAVDFEKANKWYREASVQGDGLAVGNLGMLYIRGQGVKVNKVAGIALLLISTTMDTSPENQARNNISKTSGLTAAMVTEAQALSDEMSEYSNILVPLDNYLRVSE